MSTTNGATLDAGQKPHAEATLFRSNTDGDGKGKLNQRDDEKREFLQAKANIKQKKKNKKDTQILQSFLRLTFKRNLVDPARSHRRPAPSEIPPLFRQLLRLLLHGFF